ncbi:DUF1919 domain-containing protein [Bacteroides sp.]|uniref:DUF1919 domain-containing protein n=1 Tax=Bacteroides sp. TaxID=29523 RepID=UPI0025C716AC|nr:DUF1919 domain-containing protein [Bacteroides sp.]
MNILKRTFNRIKVEFREKLNPYLASYKRKRFVYFGGGGENDLFTVIFDNCWSRHLYRFLEEVYNSPTIGLFFFVHDFIKFLQHLREYLSIELRFVSLKESKYKEALVKYGGECV